MKIGNRQLGPDRPCFIIAEIGLAHDGSLGTAHAYIDAVTQADAVKFQCHTGQRDAPWRSKPAWCPDETREAYWKRTGFSEREWRELADHAVTVGLEFLCSPFSLQAYQMLKPLVPAWKIASGQITNKPLLEACGDTGLPGIISMGLGTAVEIGVATAFFRDYALMVSTPQYPTPAHAVGLERLEKWGETEIVGLSDHSGTVWPGVAAAALGADLVEVHVCFDRQGYGPDVGASITVEELGRLVEGIRFVEEALPGGPSDDELERMREVYLA